MVNLKGHRALITGAGQGIGRACAQVFARQGADVIIVDRNHATVEKMASDLSGKGIEVLARTLDLTHFERLDTEIARLLSSNPVDILVNNAGFDRPGTSVKIDRQGFEAVLGVHLTAALALIKLVLPDMKAAGWGRIINVSSIYGLIGGKGEVAYSTAKAGLLGLTKSVARECGKDGITVNAVLPGLTRTPTIEQYMAARFQEEIINSTPLGRIAEPEEIARVIAFLASEDASFITGVALPVSGGWGI
ncbi:MAG: SDR family oxidoreductase [Deltaproteobacteria bacterium]|nr:SDR family oxidoreductase [Deltaproteobacteria bacterium]